jgi:hypothetical protein
MRPFTRVEVGLIRREGMSGKQRYLADDADGWSAVLLPRQQSRLVGAPKTRSTPSQNHNSAIAFIAIDIGKNSFHLVGLDARGAIAMRQKSRVARLKHYWPICRRA